MKYLKFLIINSLYIPSIIVIILINKVFKYKFYSINVSRLGHLVEDYYIYLNNKKNQKCIVFKSHQNLGVCNNELISIFEKKINFFKLSKFIEKPIWILNIVRKKYNILNDINLVNKDYKKDGYQNYSFKDIKLEYSEQHQILFNDFLLKNNIEKKKYICVSFWDMGHLDTKKYDFSHHDHRLSKCKFSNYFKTIKYLISQGYKVIRIGKTSKTPIQIEDKENFIDVSLDKSKNEILDIMLLNYCKCFISTSGGLDYLGFMFDKPMLINQPIVDNVFSEKKNVFYLIKEHFNQKTNHNLTLEDIKDLDLGFVPKSYFFKKKLIAINDNNEEDILRILKKLLNFIEDKDNYQLYHNESKKNWNTYRSYINLKHPYLEKYFKDIKCLYYI